MNIRPLTGQVLIQLLPHEAKTDTGLYLPDIAHDRTQGEKAKPRKGRVLAVGPWKKVKSGHAVLPDFKPGDTVIVSEYLTTKMTRNLGENYRICRVDHVLALLTNN